MRGITTFPRVSLAEVCGRISSGGTPSRKRPDYFTDIDGHPWVKSQELLDGVIHETSEHISDLGLANSSAKYYPENTVLLAMYGANVGQLGLLRIPATVNQAICGLSVDPVTADYRYVFYALLHERHLLTAQAAGAAQQNLNQDLIRRFEILLPPLPTQHKIAAILSAYDDLIENSNRRIKVLEEMAQRIYREWFVDFRYPGHEDVPLMQSDLGPIPKGWAVHPLSCVTETVTRGVSPKYSEESPQLVINQKCIRNGRLDLDLGRCHQTTVPIAKVLQREDVLVNSTGVGTLGRVAQVLFEPRDLTVDSHVTIVRPAPEAVTAAFLGLAMLAREADIAAMGVGSTGQTELNRGVLAELPLLVAPIQLQERFAAVIGPLRVLPGTLTMIAANLRAARDLLLSRLISGEIDVADLDVAAPELAA